MRLDDEKESSNFEIQRGGGGGGGFGGGSPLGLIFGLLGNRLGIGGIIILVIAMFVFKISPAGLLGGAGGGQPQVSTNAEQLSDVQHWSLKVLGSTERTWSKLFEQSGKQYEPTTLVFYTQNGMSGCGAAQSAMGPFYCPQDKKVYLDTTFYDELHQRFGAPGDFAQAYVIAHEVGHHVQDLMGTLGQVNDQQRSVSDKQGNALQVKIELQADCYAGVWAKDTGLMEAGDIEEGMTAANAIGDDTLQKSAGHTPMPDSFTHGSSEQRKMWLKRGLDSGDPAACDTFSA
jgi:Predicted metalloprotease